jgi:putative restriction endonuclease
MVKAVFTHADGSKYDDLPEARYHFPQTYLRAVQEAVGDWIVYYEPRRIEAGSEQTGGRQAYFAVAKVKSIERDFSIDGHYYAHVSDYLNFPNPVPFRDGENYRESMLQRPDGKTSKGAFGRSVRTLPETEFNAIVAAGVAGVRDELGADDWVADSDLILASGFHDPATPFLRPILERITRKPFREAAFARQVKSAYGARCAMTGLRILNGGGRPEVQAAHIRPVSDGGPDAVRNGIALCGTAHWMFDRGLISIDDDHSILVAKGHVPEAVQRLLQPDLKLLLPKAPHLHPHPEYLAHHRARFKG